MKNPLRFFLLPLAWIYGLGLWIRNKFFDLNIWKSVEFELPVIKIGGLSSKDSRLSMQVSKWISNQLSNTGLQTAMIRRVMNSKPDSGQPYEYLRTVTEQRTFDTTHRIMGVSEIAYQYPDTNAVILNDTFSTKDIRGSYNVLVMNANRPFFYDYLLPVGQLRDFRLRALDAKVVFVFGSPEGFDLQELKAYLSQDVFIYFVNDLGTEIEVLQDGDKFAAEFKQYIDQSK